jgi:3-oxoacyl-[acyl-carrier protein] reductase
MNQETILITGGAGAIGAEIARKLAAPDRCVVINYRGDKTAALQVTAEIEALGGHALAVQADVSDEKAVEAMFAQIRECCGGLDVLIHNAAPDLEHKSVLKASWADFQRQIDVQVKGALLCSQHALKLMREKKRGHILGILSAYVLGTPGAGFSSYVAAKHALMGLLQCVGVEAVRWGIRVNMLSPSLNQTELVACMPERVFEIAAGQHPLGRLCTPADVAGMVKFLLSPEAAYLHLANIPVTGGQA